MASQTISAAPGRTATPARCPRCAAAITGDFKFCPACAFRLRTDPVGTEPQGGGRARTGWLVAGAVAAVAGCVVVGMLVFHPAWVQRPTPPPEPAPALPAPASYVSPVITVADMRDDLVELEPNGFAFAVPIANLPTLGPLRDDLRARFPDVDELEARVAYPIKVLRYEVTRGQYEEFLRDLVANPSRIPPVWTARANAAGSVAPEDVVFPHVPRSWVVRGDADRVVGWSVPVAEKNLPVTFVSCLEAHEFCRWASQRLGIAVRLPLAIEWVRAARAGDKNAIWPWGEEPLVYACNNAGSFFRPQPVHFRYSDPPGKWGTTREGLFSMAGNVAEWALDHELVAEFTVAVQLLTVPPYVGWRDYPEGRRPTSAFAYGGSYKLPIGDCRVDDYRRFNSDDSSRDDVGFRVVSVE